MERPRKSPTEGMASQSFMYAGCKPPQFVCTRILLLLARLCGRFGPANGTRHPGTVAAAQQRHSECVPTRRKAKNRQDRIAALAVLEGARRLDRRGLCGARSPHTRAPLEL